LKIAIIQDWLTEYGGAEKCIEAMCEVWPQAEIFTLVYHPEIFRNSIISKHKVHSSFIRHLPGATTKYRNYFMLYPFAVEQYDLRQYDVVISFSAAFSHGVLTGPDQLHICYKHTPMRYAWSGYFEYMQSPRVQAKWKNWLARYAIHRLRRWDYLAAQRPDFMIANSIEVQQRIKKYYRRDAIVINPPLEIPKTDLANHIVKEDYYFTMSRMVHYKRIDLIVKAFTEIPHRRLIVAGSGPESVNIKKLSKNSPNIKLMGFVDESNKFELLRKAKALVFAAHEDFGIVPIEAQACGTPVIAYGKGGCLETVVNEKTGLFFNEHTIDSLKEAVERFSKAEHLFDPLVIRKHAEKFSKKVFVTKFQQFVDEKYKEHTYRFKKI
jgi:glycosyltransferase involved in cell wall biosynthesis